LVVIVVLLISMPLVGAGLVSGWWLLINAGVVAAALLFERSAYRPRASNPEELQPTGERFKDPTSGELIEVWEDPRTGAREYRPSQAK
jgi:hypothetical protein